MAAVDARTDEIVVREREWIGEGSESRRLAVDELGHAQAGRSSGLDMLEAMPADETPGKRTSVARYDVAARVSA